jgi:serine/threonine protein kinase
MIPSSWSDVGLDSGLRVAWEDGDRIFFRGWRGDADGNRNTVLVVRPVAEQPTSDSLNRLAHEYGLKDDLDNAWSARPIALTRYKDRMTLVLEDPGGSPLDQLLGRPWEISRFLRIAIPLADALRRVHERGLIHKDIKPANILVDAASGKVWLTGFGIASRLPRERQPLAPPEVIAGTLAYMAPEQTGRMNRSGTRAAISMLWVSRSTRYSQGSCPSPLPIRWSGCTATSHDNRRRSKSESAASLGRSRRL